MEKKKSLILYIYPALLTMIIFAALAWKFMGIHDFSNVLVWWLMLLLLGMLFQPVSIILFRRFHDNGWNFSKVIGLALSAWLVWYITSTHLFRFTKPFCFIIISVLFVLNICIFRLYEKYGRVKINLSEVYTFKKIRSMINAEAFFFCVFVVWCYLKGYNPSAYGTEKFMDYGFLTAILKSDYMPPKDMWLAGNSINYYYVGQYICAFLIRITGVGAGYGYNLSMMMLATFGMVLPYSIAYNLFRLFIKDRREEESISEYSSRQLPVYAGIVAGLSVSIAGNMHFPIYKWILPKLNRMNGRTDDSSYWFANATRYIGYNPDVDDKTIHEFPSYSFVLGDLHAHVINIMFVLTVIAILLAWVIEKAPRMKNRENVNLKIDKSVIREAFSPWLIACMMFVGLFHMTNYWDFPIYFVVCGAIVLFVNLIMYRYSLKSVAVTAVQALAFVIVGMIVALPFTLSFDSISTGINFCDRHTKFYQLMVLWGLPLAVLLLYIAVLITAYAVSRKGVKTAKKSKKSNDEQHISRGNPVTGFIDSLLPAELFVLLIGLCAAGLILLPEIIYVVDIYGGAYKRANTMFKLVYQAYIMFGIVMSFVLVRFIGFYRGFVKSVSCILLVCLVATYGYFFEACGAWFTGFYKTLDSSEFLQDESPEDYAAVKWINENVDKDDVVLEMCGLSYTFFNRISVFTGNQTVLGWQTHEWLWRSSGEDKSYPQDVAERHTDIVNIYTSENVREVLLLLKKYNIKYVYVGDAERFDGYSTSGNTAGYHGGDYQKIVPNSDLLKQLGEVTVFSENSSMGNEIYIVKIDYDKSFSEEIIENQSIASKQYNYSRPDRIVIKNTAEEIIGYKTFAYDGAGHVVTEQTLDADGNVTNTSVYSYENNTITFGEDKNGFDEKTGFWNYINYDEAGNCTLAHYFAQDDSWVKTVTTDYYKNGAPKTEAVNYSDGHTEIINYELDESGLIITKSLSGAETDFKINYVYEGDDIVRAEQYVEGELYKTMYYEYDSDTES